MADMDSLVLQINKVVTSVDNDRVEYNARERGKVLDVKVIGTDQVAYDLTGKHFRFVENKDGGKVVIDDEADAGNAPDGAGKFTRVDDKNGEFQYEYSRYIYQASGEAWFEVYSDSDHIDTTQKFYIDIDNGSITDVNNDNYVTSMAAEVAGFKSMQKQAQNELTQQLTDLKTALDKALSDTQNTANQAKTDAVNAIKEARDTATTTLNNLNSLYSDYNTKYKALETNLNNVLTAINQNATDEINKIKSDYATETQNRDTDYKKQMGDAIAEVTKERDSAIAAVKQAKTDAINKATSDFNNQLSALQSDYDTWKTKTVKDFQDTVDPIKAQIQGNAQNLTEVNKKLDDTNKAIAKAESDFASINFNDFAKKVDVYTKQEVDDKVASAGKLKTVSVNGGTKVEPDSSGNADITVPQPDLSGYDTTADVNNKLASKANTSDVTNLQTSVSHLQGKRQFDNPDFNSLTETGVYYISSPSNAKNAPTGSWGNLIVSNGDNMRLSQVYYDDGGNPPFYREYNYGNQVWSSWGQLATKADASNAQATANQAKSQATQNSNKLNVNTTLFREINRDSTWQDIFGISGNSFSALSSIRLDGGGTNLLGNFGSAIGFGGADTHAVLSTAYSDHQARITAGNGTAPLWHEDIAWKSDITNMQNQLNSQSSTINDLKNKVTNLTPFTTITQAQYDALTDAQKSSGVYGISG